MNVTDEATAKRDKVGGMAMMEEQRQAGMQWVIETIRRVAEEFNIPIDNLEWGLGPSDFDSKQHSLAISVKGKRLVEKFSYENLMDCPSSKDVQAELETRLRRFIKSLDASGKEIGFKG